MKKSDLYTRINNQILEKLNEGVIPWKMSWEVGVPANFISKKAYHGINFLSLSTKDFSSPYYLTFYQCKQKGGSIKRGEKSSMIIYYKPLDIKDEVNENSRVPFIKYSNVFNIVQTNLEALPDDVPKIVSCESIIDNMLDKPVMKSNISRCYYTPAEDYISLPRAAEFYSTEEYYSTLFHELIHWTGHGSRVNRASLTDFHDENYNYEELVAEIGSAYLCSLCGISTMVVENQSAYINGWLNLSNEKEGLFPKAAKDAQKAVDYILGTQD